MPEPDDDSRSAADPGTDPGRLAALAAARPDLHAAILANPACYPGLRDWIVARRTAAAPVAEPPVVEAPVTEPPVVEAPVVEAPAIDTTAAAPPARSHRARRRLLAGAAVLLLAAGLVGGGFVLGWQSQAELQARTPSSEPTLVEVPVPQYENVDDVLMPDTRGLPVQSALEVLGDVGIDPAIVTTSERPAAGVAGVVIEQSPAFGTRDPDAVSLVVSARALVPEVAGRASTDVVDELALLGAEVELVPTYVAGATAGTALAISPAPGEALPGQVTLQVAEASSAVYLSTLETVEGGCSTGTQQLDGVTYDDSLTCSGDVEGTSVSWLLDRAADSLEAVVGVPDDGDPATTLRVDVYADGALVGGADALYGSPATLAVPVTGALRLTLTVRLTSVTDSTWASETVALGDARVVGGADAIAALDR